MAKRKRKPVFDSDGSDSDNDGVSGFTKYVKEKSAKIQKHISQNSNNPAFEFEGKSPNNDTQTVRQDSKSSYIKSLLNSKKQRDSDKLYLQSMKNQLQNDLERTSHGNEESIITEGYQAKKKEYELASKLAEEEEIEQFKTYDHEPLGNSAQGVALKLLLEEQDVETSNNSAKNMIIEPSISETPTVTNCRPVKFENDIYIAEGYDVSNSRSRTSDREETLVWSIPLKEKLVKAFLLSTKTPEDIKAKLEQYKERHKND